MMLVFLPSGHEMCCEIWYFFCLFVLLCQWKAFFLIIFLSHKAHSTINGLTFSAVMWAAMTLCLLIECCGQVTFCKKTKENSLENFCINFLCLWKHSLWLIHGYRLNRLDKEKSSTNEVVIENPLLEGKKQESSMSMTTNKTDKREKRTEKFAWP